MPLSCVVLILVSLTYSTGLEAFHVVQCALFRSARARGCNYVLISLRGKVMRFIVSVNDIHRVISCVGATVDRNLKCIN